MQLLFKATVSLVISVTLAATVPAQERLLTIDAIYDPGAKVDFNGSPPQGLRWLKGGTHYLQPKFNRETRTLELLRVDAVTGESRPLIEPGKMESALESVPGLTAEDRKQLAHSPSYKLSPSETAILVNYGNDLFYYDFSVGGSSNWAKRLTNNPEPEVGEEFSPDGRMVSFTRNNNLYIVDVASGAERPLTTDGGPTIFNGRLDWVYQEEVYGRGDFKGYWWSPDSTKISFLRFDEKPVHEFAIPDHIPYLQDLELTAYPKAGDPNPQVRLGVVNISGGASRWIDLYKYQPIEFLIVRVEWTPDSKKVVYQVQNREQTWLDLNMSGAGDAKSETILHESSKAWVNVTGHPVWLKDGSFLWLSERSGWKHLYHYSASGKLIKQITDGKWEVRTLHGVDEPAGIVYFNGTEHSVLASDAYKINLDGTGLARVTPVEGTHRDDFNATFNLFIDYRSDINTPTQVRLFKSDGTLVRTIDENKVASLAEYRLGQPEFVQVKTRDGFIMEAMMIKPPGFNPNKKYPVWSYTYSGPHAQSVTNSWGRETYMWHQLLAQKDYIIWVCDNRTASGKGAESTWPVYKNFGELELRDLEDGLSWLKNQPYVDGSRIGLWGWSYGGFMTSYALTHSKTFKVGIAGGTVSDWRDYDTVYTERYMAMPQNNLEGYHKSSPRWAAKDLSGKLLLIHGLMDDNVHVQNTVQLTYELQRSGKQFDLMLYPKSRHGVTDPALVKHMRAMMTDFITKNL